MPLEFRFTPTVTQKKEKLAVVSALTTAVVALVFRMIDTFPLAAQILFILSASIAIFLYIRYFHYSYTYRLTEDGLFEVVRTDGKRINVMLSVPLLSVAECRVVRYKEKPKKAFSFLPVLFPQEVFSVKLSDGTASRVVLLDATSVFTDEFRRRAYAAKCALHADDGDATDIDIDTIL